MLPLVVRIKKKDGQELEFAFAESPIRIGPIPLNHIELKESYISRFQAVIRFDRDEINYFNVGRTNSTHIDGREVNADDEVRVLEGNVITIETTQIQFSREAVPEEKIIRQRVSVSETTNVPAYGELGETMTPSSSPSPLSPKVSESKSNLKPQPVRPEGRVQPSSIPSTAHAEDTTVTRTRIIPISQPNRTATAQKSTPSPTAGRSTVSASQAKKSPPQPVPPRKPQAIPQTPTAKPGNAASHYEAYRQSWAGLLSVLKSQLAAVSEQDRPHIAKQMQKNFPQIVREPEFRQLLKSMNLIPRKPDNPEIEEWLKGLGKDLFPKGVNLASGMTFERIARVMEVFGQVFVEIQAAQNEARRQMALQSAETSSLLSSEDWNVVLAYLLNPTADPNQRLMELRQCVTKLAIHETALFGAIKDGVYKLLESISPETISKAEGTLDEQDKSGGLLDRFKNSPEDAKDAKLWRRYREMHENLMDGKYYQRRFIGREFARTYLHAMKKILPN